MQNLAKKQAQKCKNRADDFSVIIVRLAKARGRAKPEHIAIISRASKQIKAKPSAKSSKNRKNLSKFANAYFRALLDYKRDFCKRAKCRYYRQSSTYFCKRKILA